MIRNIFILFTCLTLAISCHRNPDDNIAGMKAVNYQATDAIIANPERGFYSAAEISRVSISGIAKESMEANRKSGRTLFLLEFHMKDYVNSAIADDYLQTIRAKFQSLREGGAKCILRFCYSNGNNEKDKPWDATPAQTLSHIAQLKPLIQEFSDVIMVVQAGFIGSWGEWYYTDNYGNDADPNRKAVVDALLDAVPTDRQIELRTPAFKMALYGFGYADTLTRSTAHQANPKSRLGGHNDCYLAGANDQGTYRGNNDRNYWGSESRYTIMGGETCGLPATVSSGLLENIDRSVDILRKAGAEGRISYEFRTTVVRELHTKEDIVRMGEWMKGDDSFFLQAFVDSGDIIRPGLTGYSKDELQELLTAFREYLPKAQLRGI